MRLITENVGMKLLSVLIAFLLWTALVDEPELIETVTVPVEYRNLANSLDLSPNSPNTIQLQVRGARGRLNDVSTEKTNIVLDLGVMTGPSSKTFTIQENSINLPASVTLVRSIPSQLRVQLERRVYRDLPVSVAFEQPVPEHIKVLAAEAFPAQVKVVGPESRVNAATGINTEPIDLREVNPAKAIRVNVLLTDSELTIVGSPQVTVKLQTSNIAPQP